MKGSKRGLWIDFMLIERLCNRVGPVHVRMWTWRRFGACLLGGQVLYEMMDLDVVNASIHDT